MRILVLNYEFPPLGGGASPVSYELARELVQRGNNVDVVTMAFSGLPAFEIKDGINIHRVKCLRRYKEICRTHEMLTYVLSAKAFLKKHMQDNSYDICHCHFIIPTGIVARWLKKKYDLPYMITAHGSDVPGYNPDRFQLAHKFTRPLLGLICRDSAALTTPSQYLADLIRQQIGLQHIQVVPNGSTNFYREGISKEKIIVSSGRLLKRKGFHLLIKCFDELKPEGWRLYIVGDGPFGGELKNLTKNPNIIFTGWLDNASDEYVELMNRASIFALLSSQESQGIVYLEAMSCGCAILASDTTACRETVSEDVGFRVSLEQPRQIRGRLEALIENEGKRRSFMGKSRERYLRNFQYSQIASSYMNLFDRVFPE